MATVTPADIASWPAPNYDHPHTRIPILAGLEIPFAIIMTAFVATRFYGRACITKILGADDWVMLAAWAFTLSQSLNNLAGIPYGNARHLWDVRPETVPTAMKLALVAQALFPPAAALTKISVCMTYLRIFPSKLNRYFCYVAIGYEVCWGIASFFGGIFMCIPVSTYWDVTSPHGSCIDEKAFLMATAALNNVSDFLIFLWPARFLWQVQLPTKQRLGLIAMFAMGSLVCIAGVCRIWYFTVYFASYDAFWEGSIIYSILAVETDLGVIFGCLPGCKPVVAACFPVVFGTSGTGGGFGGNSSARPDREGNRTFGSMTVGSSGDGKNGKCKTRTVELSEFRPIEDEEELVGLKGSMMGDHVIKQEREFKVEVVQGTRGLEMGGCRTEVCTTPSSSGSGKSSYEGRQSWAQERDRRMARRETNIYSFA